MAQIGAVHAVGQSIVRQLAGAHGLERTTQAALPPLRRTLPACRFEQVSGAQLEGDFAPAENLVTFYLFRLGIDRTQRAAADPRAPGDPKARPLCLDLHYLITAWATESADEQNLLSWTMLELQRSALLDRARLVPHDLWAADEAVQIAPSEMTHENMMRIWDALRPAYRLSVSYIARTVRIETGLREAARPVVAARYDLVPHPARETEPGNA